MVHNSASLGYQKNSEAYAKIRPSYHPDLIKRFQNNLSDGVVVDLGAGTGIFTRQLVQAGYSPIAIEPVEEMRSKLTNELPDIDVRSGTAEETGLETGSVDAVVVAQAFHWFDYQAALAEIRRILHPGGLLTCVWNVRDESIEWVRKYETTLNRYAGDTPRHRTLAWLHAINGDSSLELIDEWSVPNPKPSTADGVVERALSTSFIAALEPEEQEKVLNEVRLLVLPLGEKFYFPYNSEIQIWRNRSLTSQASGVPS